MKSSAPSLFDAPVSARHDGPDSSRRAARRLSDSKVLRTQREKVLAAVIQNAGATSAELGDLSGVGRYNAARRLPEMRKSGLVVNGGTDRICRITGVESLTWYPMTAAVIARADGDRPSSPTSGPAEAGAMDPIDTGGDGGLIAWFHEHRHRLPSQPFNLRPGVRVAKPALFYTSLEGDISAGPSNHYLARTVKNPRWSPLLGAIRDLKRIVESSG